MNPKGRDVVLWQIASEIHVFLEKHGKDHVLE